MTDRTPHHTTPRFDGDLPGGLPDDLGAVAAQLDDLAARERDAVPAGLADRIADVTVDDLGTVPVIGRIGFRTAAVWGGGLAAAVAILAAVPLLLVGGGRHPAGTNPDGSTIADATDGPADRFEAEVEADLATLTYVAGLFDDDKWSADLTAVGDDAAELDAALDNPWSGLDTWITESDGDA